MNNQLCVQLVPLFQKLIRADQEEIEKIVHHTLVQKGNIVYAPNEEQQLIILEAGRVKVERLMENGDAHLQTMLYAGDFIGENWLFGTKNNNVFLTAEEDSHVCRINADQFKKLLIELPQLSYELTKHTVNKINTINQQNYYLTIYKTKDRIMTYLMDLIEEQESYTIKLPFNLKNTASYLGTTPETISRVLKDLVDKQEIKRLSLNRFIFSSKIQK
ncbi:Crp/Fnr family transcriptional regulator [Weissella coleopterorum]|uniref:Crp/Fnr family transcriptional regulator n=2 Tax=Weissella coleopterorum TaxID=2714949 RepID=A0A6G8B1S6_9LACO|nr:Crp/Fnr family transcriptional regulator [Weissella coleopterorum]